MRVTSHSSARLIFDRVLIALAILALWEFAGRKFGVYWLSSPGKVAERGMDWIASGELFVQSGYTLLAAFIGFLVGAVPGIALPMALRRTPVIAAILDPYIVGGYALPKIALIPLFIIWFGIGLSAKVALVSSLTFFLVYFNTQAGIRAIDPRLIQMGEILGGNTRRIARLVVWPAIVPYVFAGLRISLPFSIGATAVAELLTSNRGLGYLIQVSATGFDATGSFTALVALTFIVAVANMALDHAEMRFLNWRPVAFEDKRTEATPA